MKKFCELNFSINNQTVLLKFDLVENNPLQVNYVHLPAYDMERIKINKMLRTRFLNQGIPSSEIPLEPFPLGYSFNDLSQDLSVISRAIVKISVDSYELTLSLLEEIVCWHFSKYGRLMRNDLETYATICVCVTNAFKGSELSDFQDKKFLYDKVFKVVREKYSHVYQHTELIQL
jgi:hypothetical protein